MDDPLSALVVGLLLLGAVALVVWPRKGLIARWRQSARNSQRVRIEDALKHIYDCEYRRLICTRQSVAGVLMVSVDDAARLLARLEELGLLRSQGDGFALTDEGRSYALRVIRVHRLWERYLADETGVANTEWHRQAEEREHLLTAADADALAARMGNPRFDPHGDPIPTRTGQIPHPKGVSLTAFPEGEIAEIVHIEDEPAVVFAQIATLGLVPGMRVHVITSTTDIVRLKADGIECVLHPLVASNITVQSVTSSTPMEGPFESLDLLEPGEKARVVGIARTCRGLQRRRLMDLGVVPGTEISVEMRSATGDPTAYSIRGASIALRKQQARHIQIERQKEVVS
jgi:DtxR family Mn-dependent transcriptional regulator